MLSDYGIKAQLTATERVGIHRYTFPNDTDGNIILDLIHGIYNYNGKVLLANIRVENDTLITGYRITNGWARTNYTFLPFLLTRKSRITAMSRRLLFLTVVAGASFISIITSLR